MYASMYVYVYARLHVCMHVCMSSAKYAKCAYLCMLYRPFIYAFRVMLLFTDKPGRPLPSILVSMDLTERKEGLPKKQRRQEKNDFRAHAQTRPTMPDHLRNNKTVVNNEAFSDTVPTT